MQKINSLSVSIVCLLLISTGHAAEEPEDLITQAQLSQCRDRTSDLADTQKQLNERFTQFKTQKETISRLENDRDAMYSTIDFHQQLSVDNYNQLNEQIEDLAQTYRMDTEHFNNAVRQYKVDIEAHTLKCDAKHYYK